MTGLARMFHTATEAATKGGGRCSVSAAQHLAVTARLRSSSFGEALHLGRATTEPWQSRAHCPPKKSSRDEMNRY